jgi:hypothetical protein
VQDLENILVAGYDPGVEEGIPVHRIFGTQSMEQWIGISQNLRLEQVVETQFRRFGGWD